MHTNVCLCACVSANACFLICKKGSIFNLKVIQYYFDESLPVAWFAIQLITCLLLLLPPQQSIYCQRMRHISSTADLPTCFKLNKVMLAVVCNITGVIVFCGTSQTVQWFIMVNNKSPLSQQQQSSVQIISLILFFIQFLCTCYFK